MLPIIGICKILLGLVYLQKWIKFGNQMYNQTVYVISRRCFAAYEIALCSLFLVHLKVAE